MELPLRPRHGYYMAGARKLGRDGDFVPLRKNAIAGRALERQIAPLMESGWGAAGNRRRHRRPEASLLWSSNGRVPAAPYLILEERRLRSRSRILRSARAAHRRVGWLTGLPPAFAGVVIETKGSTDAAIASSAPGKNPEGFVQYDENSGRLHWPARSTSPSAGRGRTRCPTHDYKRRFICSPRLHPQLGAALGWRGFLLDTLPRHDYYHPQRAQGR